MCVCVGVCVCVCVCVCCVCVFVCVTVCVCHFAKIYVARKLKCWKKIIYTDSSFQVDWRNPVFSTRFFYFKVKVLTFFLLGVYLVNGER